MDQPKPRKVIYLSAPRMQRDGKAIELHIRTEDNSEQRLLFSASNIEALTNVVMSAYQVAKTREVLLSEEEPDDTSKELELTPLLIGVHRFGFVTLPKEGLGLLIVSSPPIPELHLRFDWHQLRALVQQIQELDNIQSAEIDNTLPM